jgi:uncharacterized membrane protein
MPLLLAAHVTLALALFLPSLLLPFTLRTRGRDGPPDMAEPGPVVRLLLWLETHGALVIGVGVAVTGFALLASVGWAFLSQPWLLAALAVYAAVLLNAAFIQRPAVRRLLRLPLARDEAEQERWRTAARRQRYLSYLAGAAIGLIAWLMMAKPGA